MKVYKYAKSLTSHYKPKSLMLVLICLLLVAALCIGNDTDTVHIPAGNVTSYQLNIDGETYVLDGNVSSAGTAFTIAANNITFDGQGHYINYASTATGSGIAGTDYSGIVIKNAVFSQVNRSVSASSAVYLTSINNCRMYNVTGISFNGAGIKCRTLTNITVENCTGISGSDAGFGVSTAVFNSTFTNCTGTSNSSYGLFEGRSSINNTFTNIVGTSGSSNGVRLTTISDNTFINCTGNSISAYAFYLTSSVNNTFTNCNAYSSTNDAFILSLSSNNVFTNCRGRSISEYGLHMQTSSNNNKFINCEFDSTDDIGLYIYASDGTNITGGSSSSYGHHGIVLNDASNGVIRDHVTSSVTDDAMFIEDEADNNIIENITCNSDSIGGIRLYDVGDNDFEDIKIKSPIASAPHTTNDVLLVGDTLTLGGVTGTETTTYGAWGLTLASELNEHGTWYVSNVGIGLLGNETTAQNRRLFTQYLDIYEPSVVIIGSGTDDVNEGRNRKDIINDILWMAQTAESNGARAIILLPPAVQLEATNNNIILLCEDLSAAAEDEDIAVINVYDVIDATPYNGEYDAYVADNYIDVDHPDNAANVLIGKYIARNVLRLT